MSAFMEFLKNHSKIGMQLDFSGEESDNPILHIDNGLLVQRNVIISSTEKGVEIFADNETAHVRVSPLQFLPGLLRLEKVVQLPNGQLDLDKFMRRETAMSVSLDDLNERAKSLFSGIASEDSDPEEVAKNVHVITSVDGHVLRVYGTVLWKETSRQPTIQPWMKPE